MRIVDIPETWRSRALVLADVALPGEWFTAEELAESLQFARAARRVEWLSTRVAAKELAMLRGLCVDPRDCVVARPRLAVRGSDSDAFVSLSHSRGFAAAAIDSAPVGIDLEVPREIREAAAHLFLDEREAGEMSRCRIAHRLIHFWAAKEAAWKQQLGEIATLKQVPLRLIEESATGLRFDRAETYAATGVIVAVTSGAPTSSSAQE